MLTGPARAGERMEKNEIAHLKIFALRHRLFFGEGTFLLASEQFFFASQELSGLRDRHD
jgi:hypothetical protein